MLAEYYCQLFIVVSVAQFPSCSQGSREGRGEVVDTNKEDRGISGSSGPSSRKKLGRHHYIEVKRCGVQFLS